MRHSKARHFHDLLEDARVLKHFQPRLDFPPRHVFWDAMKDPDSITQRWEELRGYFERLLNQPEELACPLVYDGLGLAEAAVLKASQEVSQAEKLTRSQSLRPRSSRASKVSRGTIDTRTIPNSPKDLGQTV
eukprot:SAG31_NODE_293_length_18292_cov_8.779586_8_plen_132_part_00